MKAFNKMHDRTERLLNSYNDVQLSLGRMEWKEYLEEVNDKNLLNLNNKQVLESQSKFFDSMTFNFFRLKNIYASIIPLIEDAKKYNTINSLKNSL